MEFRYMWILLNCLALVTSVCATEQSMDGRDLGRDVNFYLTGPLSEDEDVFQIADFDDADRLRASSAQAAAEPAVKEVGQLTDWKEPRNEMNLVRLFNGLYYEKQYLKINEFLVNTVNTSDFETNMQRLSEWFQEEKQKQNWLNQATVEALDQILRLRLINEDYKCNRGTYEILKKNNYATNGLCLRKPSKLGPLRRVEALVHQVFRRHALECRSVYLKEFERIRDQVLNPDVRELSDKFIELTNDVKFVLHAIVRSKEYTAMILHTVMLELSLEDPNRKCLGMVVDELRGKFMVARPCLKDLLRKYIIDPCRAYNQALGPDVFVPYRFDYKVLADHEVIGEQDFLFGLFHHRICEILIERDESQLTDQLAKYVENVSRAQ